MTLAPPRHRFEQPTGYRDLIRAPAAGTVRFIDVPPTRDLAVDGQGPPGGESFGPAFQALYPVAYSLHFILKRRGIDAPIGALEGIFWPGDGATDDTIGEAAATGIDWETWRWSLRLPIAPEASDAEIADAIAEAGLKKGASTFERLTVDRWVEGPSAQILHRGPYDAEPDTIARLHGAIAAAGLRPRGRHHEIYLSDPGRTAPERLRTLIRQPVAPT
jgi:hypothetical protein